MAYHCPASVIFFCTAGLFKEEGRVTVVAEVADTLGADDAARPFGSDKMIELVNVECRTAVIDEGADAVLFRFAVFVMVMVVVVPVGFLVMMLFLVVMVMMRLLFLLFGHLAFYFANPAAWQWRHAQS